MSTAELVEAISELNKSKENVRWLLDHNGLVDMHGLEYWAERVERLRELVKTAV